MLEVAAAAVAALEGAVVVVVAGAGRSFEVPCHDSSCIHCAAAEGHLDIWPVEVAVLHNRRRFHLCLRLQSLSLIFQRTKAGLENPCRAVHMGLNVACVPGSRNC